MKETEEQALERYLQRSGPLSRAYQDLGDERPSPALDQAVIAAARSATGEQVRRRGHQWRWPALAALAATVLLSFGLVMRIALEPQQPAATAAKKGSDSKLEDSSLARQNAASPTSPALESAAPAESMLTGPTATTTAPASDASAVVRAFEAPNASKEDQVHTRNEQDQGSVRAALRSKAAGARHDGAGIERSRSIAPSSAADETKPATAEATPSASTMAPPPAEGMAVTPMSPASEAPLQKAVVKPPEEWLDEIASLRANGEEEAAEREYAEFRKAYPDYVPGTAPTPTR